MFRDGKRPASGGFRRRRFGDNKPRGGFGSNRPRTPFRGRKMFGQRIDPSKFVSNAKEEAVEEVFVPKHSFSDFTIDQRIKNNIAEKGYKTPTAIQDKTIPEILAGKDVVGIANTGTGKTGAFLIPLLNKVINNRNEKVLIVVPTRELAVQIMEEFKTFAGRINIYSVCVVGGAHIGRQISELKRPYNFVVGTPGRIKDLMDRKAINLSGFGTLVLDEADRMLDMGFINEIRNMVSKMPAKRHTLFFSATLSKEIEKLIGEFLTNEIRISVKTRDTAKSVHQEIVKIERGQDKFDVLHSHLSNDEFEKVLVFGRTKHGVEKLSKLLVKKGHKADSIHGNKSHSQRQRSLKAFKDNHVKVLVATDVAARGLDISDVSHVINYDQPATYEDYVHRIGRTGRGNKKGKAITFVE